MQVTFTRWSVKPSDRTSVSVDPTRVESVEHFSEAHKARWEGDDMPTTAAVRIVMRNKKEYMVQGTVEEVVNKLNSNELN